ncbi:putative toxin-antitoxin system toxin component, PIN family [Spirosoma sp. HMF4905]|uniref:Putative toxin-antitoxin system toxin component, PIN family n=1 Tax=Spirosoma arboris TaxID=2682092 RepID=A0A7K1SIE7_9BACT|nr:putative toxin-antitoxin system toxin component, PIN family [Spirosoma arboris]MVM33545.1 putative toxin-antitoxin system toxin component, PIN family [Spirosoma arboris]
MSKKPRIVIDPNLLASVLIGGRTRTHFYELLEVADQIDICYADELVAEVEALPRHSYFQQKGIDEAITHQFLTLFTSLSLKVFVTSKVKVGRDENDFYLLSLCRDARADYLLTGDPDLLILGGYGQTKILRFPEILELLPDILKTE